jgi:hypothetical protein
MGRKFYVSMTDRFLSVHRQRINKLVIECDSYEEAEVVERNARDQSEMRYINICSNKPRYPATRYDVSWKTKENASNWFRTDRPFRW